MRIGIDARYLSHGIMGGINSYLRNLLPVLFSAASDHHIFLYADTKRSFELTKIPGHITLRLLPYRNTLSSLQFDFFMRREMEKDKLDIVHFPANYGFGPKNVRSIITLHDEINIMPLHKIISGHPKKASTILMMMYLHLCTRAAVRRVNWVITISEYAREQILRWGLMPKEKVRVIYHGTPHDSVRIENADEIKKVREAFDLKKAVVLADALKNPGVLVRAWERLPTTIRSEAEIIFFSRSEIVRPDVHQATEAGFAKLLVKPERKDLITLYNIARVFVFPSWIEGFGIPLLEAMSCGAPIIASDRGSIPEIMGNAGFVIDAEDDIKLAEYLEILLTNPKEHERLRELGFSRVKKFTWEESAKQLLKTYQELLQQE